jgi:[ribosomal protein S5]-alanine N-acetyltransferase
MGLTSWRDVTDSWTLSGRVPFRLTICRPAEPMEQDVVMPDLVPAAVPAGRLADQAQPILRAGDLALRPWRVSDADAVVAAYRDPDIQHWHVRSMTHDEAVSWLRSWADQWRAETGAGWAVTEQDIVVGRLGFRLIDLTDGTAEIAYWTVPAARGRGIAARAVLVASTWMFESVGFHRLALTHSTRNLASCRIAEKTGYRYEGTLREQVRHQDGWHDMHLHARLALDEPAGG